MCVMNDEHGGHRRGGCGGHRSPDPATHGLRLSSGDRPPKITGILPQRFDHGSADAAHAFRFGIIPRQLLTEVSKSLDLLPDIVASGTHDACPGWSLRRERRGPRNIRMPRAEGLRSVHWPLAYFPGRALEWLP